MFWTRWVIQPTQLSYHLFAGPPLLSRYFHFYRVRQTIKNATFNEDRNEKFEFFFCVVHVLQLIAKKAKKKS